jgi:hypothetical protein
MATKVVALNDRRASAYDAVGNGPSRSAGGVQNAMYGAWQTLGRCPAPIRFGALASVDGSNNLGLGSRWLSSLQRRTPMNNQLLLFGELESKETLDIFVGCRQFAFTAEERQEQRANAWLS